MHLAIVIAGSLQYLKGGGYGHLHFAFLVPMFSLGDAETHKRHFKIFS